MTKTKEWKVESPDRKNILQFTFLSTESNSKYLSLEWVKNPQDVYLSSTLTVCGITFDNYPIVLTAENARKYWDDLSKAGWTRKS